MQQIKEYFKEIGDCEVFNWRGAYSPLFAMFRWNDEKYYKNVYKRTPISPILQLTKDRETDYLFNNDYYESYAVEMLERYLGESKEVEQINRENDAIAARIEAKYKNLIISDLATSSDSQLGFEASDFNALLGELVARTVWVEQFDENTLHRVLSDKSNRMIDKIWEKATHPHFENFETRRLKILLQLIEADKDSAGKMARFIFTDYFEVKDDSVIENKIKEIFIDREKLWLEVRDSEQKLAENRRDFELWLNTLTTEEQIVARYIQMIMQIRDWRKDPIAQAQAAFSSIAKELFLRAEIDVLYISYVTPHELTLGSEWLKTNKNDVMKRIQGVLFYALPQNLDNMLRYNH